MKTNEQRHGIPKRFGALAWRRGLNHPIYIPKEIVSIKPLLSNGQVLDACNELWRLALLGSDPAAAVLGCIFLRGVDWKGAESGAILNPCREAAIHGNSYAQYVMALYERKYKDYLKEWKWLHMSNKQGFAPALAESGRMAASLIGKPDLARIYLWRGIRQHHIPSMIYYISICLRGAYGPLWRVFGIVSFPFAVALMGCATLFFPFSLSVFVFMFRRYETLFDDSSR